MFQQLFKRDETVRRHLAAPLPRSRRDYLAHRAEQGTKPCSLQRIARVLLAVVLSLKLGRAGKAPPPARLAGTAPPTSQAIRASRLQCAGATASGLVRLLEKLSPAISRQCDNNHPFFTQTM